MPGRPGRVVAFLLTDIEGSTPLWQRQPKLMRETIERHDRLLNEGIRAYGGRVLTERGEGDSFFAVFNRASDALAAARDLQQALHAEPWPEDTPIRVRMAINTGEAASDYRGMGANRCARIRQLASGGQVLVSQSTQALVRDEPPDGVTLLDMGLHKLRGVDEPERIYEARIEGLAVPEFGLVSDTTPPRHNLPLQLTSFIGREHELQEIKEELAANRLVTLTGAGGCGKTRLALQTAAEVVDDYPDGAFFVDMAPVGDPTLVPSSVATALAVREQPGRPLESTVVEHLAHRRTLLVVDNCEHLVEGCAALVGSMLAGAPELRVLATSQAPLDLPGEVRWRVPSLALPASEESAAELESLLESEAVRLFVERARLARPDFALDDKTGFAVAQICRRLDGIPLAIELAAAQTAVLTPQDILARLDDRFRLLGSGKRRGLARQQTLLAAVSWSHNPFGFVVRIWAKAELATVTASRTAY